jgi:hypothetical protein
MKQGFAQQTRGRKTRLLGQRSRFGEAQQSAGQNRKSHDLHHALSPDYAQDTTPNRPMNLPSKVQGEEPLRTVHLRTVLTVTFAGT